MNDVPLHQQFLIKDGPALKNLFDLERELNAMTSAQFSHHVNDAKNDFYNWVYHVVKDETLAIKMSRVQSKSQMAKIVNSRIKELTKKVVVRKVQKQTETFKQLKKIAIPVGPDLSELKSAPALSISRAAPPAPVPHMPTLEDVEAMVSRKIGNFEPAPIREISEPQHYPENSPALEATPVEPSVKEQSDLTYHLLPYGLGLMAGILAGLVIARYFV